jgi:hypothetical protein
MINKGRKVILKGSQTKINKLTEVQIPVIRAAYKNGATISALSKQYDVTRPTIRAVVTGKTWRHVL